MRILRNHPRIGLITLVAAVCSFPVCGRTTLIGTSKARNPWIRHIGEKEAKGAIIFIHGVTGDAQSTWSSASAYWPEMLTHDPVFNGQDIYVYEYPSPKLGRSLTVDELADNLRLVLSSDGILRYRSISFVSHSMGGLVTRAFIVKYQTLVKSKIRLLYFFATPTAGTPYAYLAKFVSANPQFGQLYPMNADSYLAPLQSNWLAANMHLRSYCAYETLPLYGVTTIVEMASATHLCTERLDPINSNHIDIVKPASSSDTPYMALKSAFEETEIALPDAGAGGTRGKTTERSVVKAPGAIHQESHGDYSPNVIAGNGNIININSPIQQRNPRFREGVSEVTVAIGGMKMHLPVSFFSATVPYENAFMINGTRPFKLYLRDGALLVSVHIATGVSPAPIDIVENEIHNPPPGFDRNFDDFALEFVDSARRPIFQIVYLSDTDISIRGAIDLGGNLALLANETQTRRLNASLPIPSAFLPATIFEYPSSGHKGERAKK